MRDTYRSALRTAFVFALRFDPIYVLRMGANNRDERETLPPTLADAATEAFETCVRTLGESRARWDRLMALLDGAGETI